MKLHTGTARARGFTLAEAIIVIAIIGVIAAVVATFIRNPIRSYVDSVARAELTDQADLALRRMARDIRLALPNSIHTIANETGIEFILTKAGGRYLSVDDAVAGPVLDFDNQANKDFTVVGAMRTLSNEIVPGDYVVVNNQGVEGPSNAYLYVPGPSYCSNCNIARVADVTRDAQNEVKTIKLEDNPFGRQSTSMPSPSQHFQLVSGPVTYACAPDANGTLTLTRYWNYPFVPDRNSPPTGQGVKSAPIASRLATCADLFKYDNGAQRIGLVILTLALKARNEAESSLRLVHQVHISNTP
jgi:MSHA biogenesis protein MshO